MSYNNQELSAKMANAIRFLSVDAIEKSKSGHPGMPLGMADVATVLFSKFIKVNPLEPTWFNRDRFVLSAGHGSMLLYSMLYLMGYKDVGIEDIKNFRQLGAKTAGHPECGHINGVDITTGPLGQGISSAVGMALAERKLNSEFGDELCNHYTYVIAGDGCLMEGISQEAISLAGHWGLGKLIVFWDNNNITIDGNVDATCSTNQAKRFEASGWNVIEVDGHNQAQIASAITKAQSSDKPTLISCKTTIGFGAPNKQGTSATHGSPLGADEAKAMRDNLGWNYASFEVPQDVLDAWKVASARAKTDFDAWSNLASKNPQFVDAISNKLPQNWDKDLNSLKQDSIDAKTKVATRKSSQMCLEKIVPNIAQIVGGSADLAASNLTFVKGMKTITKEDYSGNNIMYGVREHVMGAIANGLALHGGVIPYVGTFFVFSDYMRPSIRLSALMGLPVVYVLTHDSIGVGEDGPTHQPIEHLASFRAMPNVNMFRPCDVVETAEAWQISLESESTPSLLALSRQNLPLLRTSATDNLTKLGGYVISSSKEARDATIIATGSEVALAVEAQAKLMAEGIDVAVVSMPCTRLFDLQSKEYKSQVLGSAPRIVVEAGSSFGWDKYVGEQGKVIAIDTFGISAPGDEIFAHFGLDVDNVTASIKSLLGK